MGSRYEVKQWRPQPAWDQQGWRWEIVYYGNNPVAALWTWLKLARGAHPVMVIWR